MAMAPTTALQDEVRALLVDTLMLQIPASEIGAEQPLFGPGGLGLDSVDALQLVVALDKRFGLKITDTELAQKTLKNVTTIADAVGAGRAG